MLRNPVTALALAGFVLSLGCNKETAGGPGAALPPSEQSTVGHTADTFTLDTPMMSTKLIQGETKAFTIGIKRGKDTNQDVALAFNDLPKGVTMEPMSPSIKHGDQDVKLTVKAADDAALGDFTVKVVGHPTTGPDATSDLKITVDKK